jgi:predicted permease
VLLIVLINVAVLMLLRATRRQKEVALRMALGAGRSNLTRMLVADACVLTATAVMVGLTLTTLTLGALAPLIEQNVGRSVPGGASMVAVDRMVLLVIGGLGVLIAGTLSLVPLLSSWRSDLFSMLRRDSRGGTGSLTGTRVRSLLAAAEISGAVALLVGCGLMVRTVMHLTRTDLGFNTDGIVRASFSLPGQPYLDPVARLAFYERLLGVLDPSASVSDWPPFVAPPLHPIEADAVDTANLRVAVLGVGGSYFQTLGVRVTEGRGFAPGDRLGSAPVAVVSASLARRLWPEGSAVGRRIHTTEEISFQAPLASWRTVVGVAADVRQTFVDNDLNDVYLPFLQVPNRFASLYLRTDAPLPLWIGQVREAVAAINPEIAVGAAPSLASAAEQLLAGPRFLTSLLSGFAVFTMLIAILGIHGVVTYSVQQREREIAIRIALGATRGGVTALLVRHGAAVLGLGILVGLAGASLVTRLLQTQLQGVGAFDAVTLMLASALLGAAGLLASWWPARRAARRDPLASLKAD